MSIYSRFSVDDIVEANPTIVTTGLWSNDSGSLESTLHLNQAEGQQVGVSGEYYLDVYDSDPEATELAEVQFAVAYGHIDGGGAPSLNENELATLPTKAIYSQYRNLLLDPSDTKFSFEGVDSDHIYVINFQRARIREQLDPGNWELPFSGARGLVTLIDDSGQTLGALTANSKAGRVFSVISGSISTTSGSISSSSNPRTFNGHGYGLVYPDLGVIVLNPNALVPALGFFISSSITASIIAGGAASSSVGSALYDNVDDLDTENISYAPVTHSLTEDGWSNAKSAYNHNAIYVAINKATSSDVYDKGFRARSAETISSTHYFVRLRNKEFNYSNNPTFYNPDNGSLSRPEFRNDPKVYITTVGLFNDQNELLAVAKLSKPVRKSFDEEVLLRVRLDF
jgi:hypothetical protein